MIDFTRTGRMLCPSKTRYHERFPDHVIYFNANICTKLQGKIWWGDIDLTLDRAELQRYANELDEEIYLLQERDGRFANEVTIPFERAVETFQPGDVDA